MTVPGKADGKIPAELSRTAVLTAIAAAAAVRPKDERDEFAEANGLGVGDRSIYRALKLRLRPAGPEAPDDPDQREWLWQSFEVDVAKLGLDLIVAWLPPPGGTASRRDQGRLLEALRATTGVIGIHDCFDDTILVQALAPDPVAKRRLQSRLQEICPEVLWAEVRLSDREQPARGWLHVARAVAAAEARLQEPATGRA